MTQQLCQTIDKTGDLWKQVMEKVQGLHPRRPEEYDEHTHKELNKDQPFGNGGMSDEYASIHFASIMTLLFKPKGKKKETVFKRLMEDWRQVQTSEWTVRPIAAGGAHDRLIERARLESINKTIHKHRIRC